LIKLKKKESWSLIVSLSALAASGIFFCFFKKKCRNSGLHHAFTGAASYFWLAVGVLTHQLAFGFGTLGLIALPVATRIFAHGLALGLGGLLESFTWQWVTQWGCLQMVTHLGQSSASQALSGHLIYLKRALHSLASHIWRRRRHF